MDLNSVDIFQALEGFDAFAGGQDPTAFGYECFSDAAAYTAAGPCNQSGFVV
jgi:hypothetical protein